MQYRKRIDIEHKLVDDLIKLMNQGIIPWEHYLAKKNFINHITKKEYSFFNSLLLSNHSSLNKYKNLEYITFLQAKKLGATIKKGSKSQNIEFFSFLHNKKIISQDEYETLMFEYREKIANENNPLLKEELKKEMPIVCLQTYNVFSVEQVDGLNTKIDFNKFAVKKTGTPELFNKLNQLLDNYQIKLNEIAGSSSSYVPNKHEINIQPKSQFKDQYFYIDTIFHELGHSTSKYLNRNIKGNFGSSEYAKEELVAELTALSLKKKLGINMPCKYLENHKAYLQSWGMNFKDKPSTFIYAVKESEKAANFLLNIYKDKNFINKYEKNNLKENQEERER